MSAELLVQRDFLRHNTDDAFNLQRLSGYRVTANNGIPAGRFQQAREHGDGCSFASAIRSQQTEDFASLDVERDTIHGGEIAELFNQVLDFEDWGHGLTTLLGCWLCKELNIQ